MELGDILFAVVFELFIIERGSWRGGERPDRRPSIAPLFYRGVWAGPLSTEHSLIIRRDLVYHPFNPL